MATLDPVERQSNSFYLTTTPLLWGGLLCVLAAAATGGLTTLHAQTSYGREGWFAAVALLVVGMALLYAQMRYPVWRRTAGVFEPPAFLPRVIPLPDTSAAKARRLDWAIGVTLVVIAAGPRLLALQHSLWFDELWTLNFMRGGPLYALTHQVAFNNHLLNSLLASLFLLAYQAAHGPIVGGLPPTWAVRLPAFLFGLASVPMLYTTAKLHTERPAAVAAAALLAFSPVAVDLSTQARGYSALIFFTIAQGYFLTRALRESSATGWLGWLVCAALGMFAHLYFVLVVMVDGIFLLGLIFAALCRPSGRSLARVLMEQGVVMALAWSALTSLCYLGVWTQFGEIFARLGDAEPMARAHDIVEPTLQLWGGVPQGDELTAFYVFSLLLVGLGLWHLAARGSRMALYLPMLLLVPPVIVELASPHYVYLRFFSFGLPAFLFLIACGVWHAVETLLGTRGGIGIRHRAALSVGCAGYALLWLPGLREVVLLPKQDYARAAETLNWEAALGHPLVVVGAGREYFRLYSVQACAPRSLDELRRLRREGKVLTVADTNLVVNPYVLPSEQAEYVHKVAEHPFAIFPGRHEGWNARWLDGDSDILLYHLPGETQRKPAR